MGKSKKRQHSRKVGDPVAKSEPLAEQILGDASVRDSQRVKFRQHAEEDTVISVLTTFLIDVAVHILGC